MDATNKLKARTRTFGRLKLAGAKVAATCVGLLIVGCAAAPTSNAALANSGPPVAGLFTEPASESEDGSDLYLPEPVTVGVMGGSLEELGDVVPIEDLIDAADSLGQDIVPQLVEEGGLSEDDLPEDPSTGLVAETAGFSTTTPSRVVPASSGAYTRLLVWNDNKYVQNVLRQGTSTWGWVHSRDKHKVTQTMIRKTTQFPRTRSVSGSNITYITPAIKYVCWLAVCSIEKQMNVRVVYETARQSDGFGKGVITTYCEGPIVCPQWVRDVAG